MTVKVLFVCLGNICRSPTAQGLFQAKVVQAALDKQIITDSAGTGDWHIGRPPDPRAQATAIERGYNISHLRGRQVTTADFTTFDYILAMDKQNLRDLKSIWPAEASAQLGLFLSIATMGERDVPDPYYGTEADFERVLQLIEDGADGLLAHIRQQHGL
jgi:protein-tyrosine phosphatase